MSIEAIGVTKRYRAHHALRDVTVRIERGGLVALLGPSGSGKTTLLRVMAGLEAPDAGRVLFSGRDVSASGVAERGVGFVFQHYALFREMTVFENVAFGLRVKPRKERPSEETIRARVHELLSLVQLEGMAQRHPSQLSGGQRQRVALARALAVEPQVLLLDEPFGALDAKVRRQLRAWLRTLHDELHVTTVLVTHDQEEALEIADRVVLMNEGRVEQEGSPTALYDAPATAFVASFLGDVNVLEGVVENGAIAIGALRLPVVGARTGERVRIAVRAGDLDVAPADDGDAHATISRIADLGERIQLEATIDGGPTVRAHVPRHAPRAAERGSRVRIDARVQRVYPAP
ncbi:sulfate/molybdate ABC transporter ATP-binding protein [Sandaracinus amylolyticus]|uniref:Sulfate and thiosulfate import ATP-binding protein CysA n=1 Tax=Sandaracinus amylolyticus TaxID=927083 RepID=A0A0F6YI06_9BACT|nr:sulfate ABC transporter ATP-binding protein [Sandaracinus amylolyticus]AKF05653.1 Sulfate and thiosulfate import ATP-binding protein CysA [Sandaracinus amylolyticus]